MKDAIADRFRKLEKKIEGLTIRLDEISSDFYGLRDDLDDLADDLGDRGIASSVKCIGEYYGWKPGTYETACLCTKCVQWRMQKRAENEAV